MCARNNFIVFIFLLFFFWYLQVKAIILVNDACDKQFYCVHLCFFLIFR